MTSTTFNVMLGTTLLGAAAGSVGAWGVLRRRALISDVLSHAALPGLCIAYGISGERNYGELLLGAILSGLLSVAMVNLLVQKTRIKQDAAMGIVLSTMYGLGVVLLSLFTHSGSGGQSAGLEKFTLGQAASITESDVWWIGGIGLLATLVVMLLYKEFKAIGFDSEFAASLGWPVAWLDLIMMGCIAGVAVIGIKAVGVLLSPALLIIPAAAARYWSNRLALILLVAAFFGAISGALGTWATSGAEPFDSGSIIPWEKLPTGPVIVLFASAIFGISLLFAPSGGLLARWRNRQLIPPQKTIAELRESIQDSVIGQGKFSPGANPHAP
jgi:manganese/zinc/iron transport system permease protein